MSNIFPIDFDEKLTMAQNDYILFSDSEDGNKIKKAQYKNLKWEKGDTWATGSAATISVWTTSSLPAWSSATVTNSGTSSAAVLNFGIPKWDKWDTWATGATGNWIASITSSKSGDTTTITITETNGDTASFTVEDGENGDAQLFTLSGTIDLTNAQAAYDWYLAGKYPVIKYGSKFYYLYSASSSTLFWVIPYDKAADSSSTTWLYRDWIKMEVSSWTITTITTTTIFVANSNYLRTGVNYWTPYTPEYNGSPATKKYVDDSASTKQDTLVSGTNIKTVNNQSLLWSWDITVTWWSDIEYKTQAEYTALLPWAESDWKHYFIYSTSS